MKSRDEKSAIGFRRFGIYFRLPERIKLRFRQPEINGFYKGFSMKKKRQSSIRARLLWAMFINLPLVWLLAILTSSYSLYNNINNISDVQMSQMARRLLSVPYFYDGNWRVPQIDELFEGDYLASDEYMTFAVWDKDERLLLADHGSYFLRFIPPEDGFHDVEFFYSDNQNKKRRRFFNRQNQPATQTLDTEQDETRLPENDDNTTSPTQRNVAVEINKTQRTDVLFPEPSENDEYRPPIDERENGHQWRVLRLTSPDGNTVVAVGQNKSVRYQTVNRSIKAQLIPWILALPILLLALSLAMRRALKPLNKLANHLQNRQVNDDTPIDETVPREMKPLVLSLNRLFLRVKETLKREQRFTSDAAHELRSPLAALKVQSEVLAMSDTEEEQTHAMVNILDSIDRAERLIGQLLAMSRLDNANDMPQEKINWEEISEKVLKNTARNAREKRIVLKREIVSGSLKDVLPLTGNPTLIELMLRNLLDNAIRYTPIHGEVILEMADDFVRVLDNGKGIDPEYLPRIRERFFRPPGQKESGSGLGLSIIDRIATLHGLVFILHNRETGGLNAEVRRLESVG